ncbi:Uncharacterised protein [Mycobacteroides abscessus subsp. abscessus]|nr:Uncharacterised protein [Mycobacteroides abscessus subsp. abscessus]
MTVTPGAEMAATNRSTWRVRTRTMAWVTPSMTSRMGPSARIDPRPMTIRWSAVWVISLIRCELSSTVRPSCAN